MCISILDIRFDVVDGRTVHQIRTEHRNAPCGSIYRRNPDGRKPQGIGPVWRTGGKDPHLVVASKPGRTHLRRNACIGIVQAESPDKPDIIESVQPVKHCGFETIAKLHYARKIRHQTRLTRCAELLLERGAEECYGLNFHDWPFLPYMCGRVNPAQAGSLSL